MRVNRVSGIDRAVDAHLLEIILELEGTTARGADSRHEIRHALGFRQCQKVSHLARRESDKV